MTIKRLLCLAVCAVGLLAGCGPEAKPLGPVAVEENTAVSQEQTTIATASATPVISATLPVADVTPTVSAMFTPTLDISEFPNPDSFKIDIFQIAAEQMAEGPASFPIQATVGEGENTLHVAAKDVGTFQFPCAFSPSPDRKHYACLTGGGMDGHVWISQWGVGPERLLTEHAVFAIAWSPNGGRLTYGTLDGIDENWTGTLRLHDLANGEDVVLGNIAAPWQTIFTSNNQLIYLHDHALQIWSIPAEKSLKEGAALERTIPLKNVPEGALFGEGASLATALSPSERYMALLRQGIGYETGTLSILDMETGEEYLVDDQLRNDQSALNALFAWSPGSDTLAYLTMRHLREDSVNGNRSQIWLVDAATQQRTLLWVAEREFLGYTRLAWLSDKGLLAAAATDPCCNLVQLIGATNGETRDLLIGHFGLGLTTLSPGLAMGWMVNDSSPDYDYPAYHTILFSYD